MNRYQRITICLFVIILLVLLCLFSCLREKEDEAVKDVPDREISTPVPTKVYTIPLQDGDDKDKDLELVKISYYAVSSSNAPNHVSEVWIDSDETVSPELILEYLQDSLEDEEIVLNLPEVTISGSVCNVDFDDTILAISKQDAVLEEHVLDAVSMSILDNCGNISDITFTINGGKYESENIVLNEGEVYLSD